VDRRGSGCQYPAIRATSTRHNRTLSPLHMLRRMPLQPAAFRGPGSDFVCRGWRIRLDGFCRDVCAPTGRMITPVHADTLLHGLAQSAALRSLFAPAPRNAGLRPAPASTWNAMASLPAAFCAACMVNGQREFLLPALRCTDGGVKVFGNIFPTTDLFRGRITHSHGLVNSE